MTVTANDRAAEPGPDQPSDATADEREAPTADRPDDPSTVTVEIKVVVAIATIAGLVLRFLTTSPLWLDEALSVNIASLPVSQIPDALRHDGHPPLYYVLLHGWMGVFGSGNLAVRSLSGLFAVVALPLAFVAGRRVGGRMLGWLMLGVFAISPFALRYATETRMYSLVTLLVLVGYILIDDVVRRGRDHWWRLATIVVVTSALLYTHYWAMWLLGCLGVLLLGVWRRAKEPSVRRGAIRTAIALVIGAMTFLPWLPVLLFQGAHTGTPWSGPVRPTVMVATTLADFAGGPYRDVQFVGPVLFLLVVLALFGVGVTVRRIDLDLRTVTQFRVEAGLIVAILVVATIVGFATRSAFATRYTATFLPLFMLLVAGGVSRFVGRWVRFGVLVAVLSFLAIGAGFNVSSDRSQVEVLAREVSALHRPGDLVVYCPDQLGPSGLRVMPDDLEQVAFPTMTRPERIDWVDYAQTNSGDPKTYAHQVIDAAGPDRGIFVVWSSGYRTHESSCNALINELGARGRPQQLIAEDGLRYFERANLTYFPPPDPTGP